MSQAELAAVEVTDVVSAANAIEEGLTRQEAPAPDDPDALPGGDPDLDPNPEPDGDPEPEQDPDADPDLEPEPPADPEPDPEPEGTFETLADLAEAIEQPFEEFMGNIKTTVKIDGVETDVTLSDLKNGYQMESDYRKKTTAHADNVRAFDQESAQKTEQLQNSLAQVDMMLTNAEQEIIKEYNAVNWAELKDTDQQEYLVQESDLNKRYQQVQQQKQAMQTQASEIGQQQQAQHQVQLRETITKEHELMMSAMPEWADDTVMSADREAMAGYLADNGFQQSEIALQQDEQGNITHPGLIDHRLVAIIRDAMLYKNQGKKVEIAKKKVKLLPKIVKPGAKQTKDTQSDAHKKLQAKAKKSGKMDDWSALIASKL